MKTFEVEVQGTTLVTAENAADAEYLAVEDLNNSLNLIEVISVTEVKEAA